MPRGSNPNSRKNLEKGIKYRFKAGDKQGKREAALARAEKDKANKTFAEELRILLATEITNSKGEKVTTRTAISTAMIKKAINGDCVAFEKIRDTVGEKPVEKVEHIEPPVIIDDVPEK